MPSPLIYTNFAENQEHDLTKYPLWILLNHKTVVYALVSPAKKQMPNH